VKMFTRPSRSWMLAFLLIALLTAGCGSETGAVEDEAAGDEAAVDIAAVDESADEDAVSDETMAEAELPRRIVSLSPTATEMLYAIGAGDQVAAVDLFSNYPPEAPAGSLDAFVPDLEAILAVEPDLVVAMFLPEDVAAGLDSAGVPVIIQPAATGLDDVYAQIADLGVATGQIEGADRVNDELRAGIDEVLAGLPEREAALTVFHEIDETFYTATSNTFIGQIYNAMGFVNIADEYDDGSGYPVVDGETIIAANPDVIVFTSQASYDAAAIAARPGWEGISAVANGRVVQIDADVSSRWGPRIVEFMQSLAEAVGQ